MTDNITQRASARLSRRQFLARAGMAAAALSLPAGVFTGCAARRRASSSKALVIGLDGVEPKILEPMLRQGRLPHFQRLAAMGGFDRITSSIPPHSPVAWANFAAGTNPGGHGIFDFIRRDPETYLPRDAIASVQGAERTLTIGDLHLPLSAGKVELLRQGPAFWQVLEEHGLPCTVLRLPSNFPPTPAGRALAGLGTPDLLGSYGTFSFYTTRPPTEADISGGEVYPVSLGADNIIRTTLHGPYNDLRGARSGPRKSALDLVIYCDPEAGVAKVVVDGKQVLLREGEWSEWVQVKFPLLWLHGVKGICRFYLKSVRPDFSLYVTPINIDPSAPALPIATPGYAQELYRHLGFYYTQGMPEDTKALTSGLLDDDEYLQQSDLALRERLAMFDYELERFREGFLFLYLSNTDRHGHMFWWPRDPAHPAHDPKAAPRYATAIEDLYLTMDGVIEKALRAVEGEDLLIVLSDHGFAPFHRAFHLNSWLRENGYLATWDATEQSNIFASADWSQTRAYALGLNCLYLNLEGREAQGIVRPGPQREALAREIAQRLLAVRDPANGRQVISNVYLTRECYSGPAAAEAPELIIGYNYGYRASWQAAVGQYGNTLVDDNNSKWSGDHCIDYAHVPGVMLCNRPLRRRPALHDIGPTVLADFGIAPPKEMTGDTVL